MKINLEVKSNKDVKRLLTAGVSLLALTSLSSVSIAQELALEEIVVSATKRMESVRDVPLAITALSGDFTREANIDDVKDLISFTPGITGNSKDSFIDVVAVRGIRTQDFGVGGDPSVGFFKNGFYQGRNGSAVTSMFDIGRSEALRGPQNFLFGRNAISGAFSIHTARPEFDAVSGYVEADIGERGHAVAEGALNLPVNENFAVRFAGYYSTENGYVNNAFNPEADKLGGFEKWAFRASADYETDRMKIQFTGEFENRDGAGSIYRATRLGDNFATLEDLFGTIELPADGRDVNQGLELDEFDRGEVLNMTLRIDFDFDFATLTSQTGYRDHSYNYREDFDGTALNINNFGLDQEGTYFEQEIRLVSNTDGPFSWYVGASYYKENLDAFFTAQGDEELMCAYYYNYYYGENLFGSCLADVYYATAVPEGLLEQGDVDAKYSGYAAYIDLSYEVNEKLDFSLGLRYSYDKKTFAQHVLPVASALGPFFTYSVTTNGFLSDTKTYNDLQPRALVRYSPDEDNTFFASVTRGYKAGGFGTFGFSPTANGPAIEFGDELQPGDAVPDDFDAESLWSYEIGHKGTYAGGSITTDLNFYYYNYKDLQMLVFQDGGGLIFNLGNVTGYGIEAAVTANLTDNISIFTNIALNETDISNAGPACSLDTCDGNRLDTPEWSGATILKAHFPVQDGEIYGSAEVFWESSKGGGIENFDLSKVDAFADVTLRLGYRQDNWSVNAYAENVFNELYYDQGNNNDGILPAHRFGPSRPRTFGMRFSYDFGE